jgi:hypothetical protein
MGTAELEARGEQGSRGRETEKQKCQEPVHKQAVSQCGLQVLIMTARNGDYGGKGDGWVGK